MGSGSPSRPQASTSILSYTRMILSAVLIRKQLKGKAKSELHDRSLVTVTRSWLSPSLSYSSALRQTLVLWATRNTRVLWATNNTRSRTGTSFSTRMLDMEWSSRSALLRTPDNPGTNKKLTKALSRTMELVHGTYLPLLANSMDLMPLELLVPALTRNDATCFRLVVYTNTWEQKANSSQYQTNTRTFPSAVIGFLRVKFGISSMARHPSQVFGQNRATNSELHAAHPAFRISSVNMLSFPVKWCHDVQIWLKNKSNMKVTLWTHTGHCRSTFPMYLPKILAYVIIQGNNWVVSRQSHQDSWVFQRTNQELFSAKWTNRKSVISSCTCCDALVSEKFIDNKPNVRSIHGDTLPISWVELNFEYRRWKSVRLFTISR